MPTENPDDRHQHPHPPPPPEPRATQRAKRGLDAMATSESRSSSLNKRRKHQPDPDRSTMAVDNNVEGYAVPFNPAVTFPMHPAPLILPQDSDLDELCISFRDTFRTLKAWYQERERTNEAAIGRANARVAQVQQSADDVSESYSERMKELVKVKDELRAIRLEIQFRDQRYRNLEDDHQRLLDQHARAQEESMQLRGEITKKDERIAVLSNALEHERRTKASETDTSTSIDAVRQELHGAQQDAQRAKQEVLGAKQDAQRAKQDAQRARQDAERADVANNLLTAEITRLRPNPAQARRRFQEVEAAHDNLGARVEDFLAQDLEGLTHKEMTKLVLGMKEAHQQQVNKAKAYRDFLHTLEHLACGEADQSSNLTLTNGQLPQHQP